MEERYELVIEKAKEILNETSVDAKYADYFKSIANLILLIDEIKNKKDEGFFDEASLDELQAFNKKMYEEIEPENYKSSFANPTYAVNTLGDEYGQMLCYVYASLRSGILNMFEGDLEVALIRCELAIEIYSLFEDEEGLAPENLKDIIYTFERDNSEIFMDVVLGSKVDPNKDRVAKIILESDLSDIRYLYKYGNHIGDNEIKMAEFLSTLSDEKIDEIASLYTEGYRRGFVATGKDLSIKSSVQLMYVLGFERIVKAAIKRFEKMGLKPVIGYYDYQSTDMNKQYAFDHKQDSALFFDKAYMKRKLETVTAAYESRKELASQMAGPARLEIFGEVPFEPVSTPEAIKFTPEQQALTATYQTEFTKIVRTYIKGEERSFTIISFPVPEFGDNFEEFFHETVKINSLDTEKYGAVQQNLIDALDKAEYVHITGRGGNKTDLTVAMHVMNDPTKETNFENCLADVNIPLGEVFTSPKLEGTNGILHVSSVYLKGLNFKELEIEFEDGKIKEYNCKNFDSEEENKNYFKENVMFNHETLPMGEFAIGTNTTAYVIANKYDCIYKLPILIVEKMGPHFAVGDTCYSFQEDVETFNPDGKQIVARENEVSALRKTDVSKAYFGCHTDVTIPYDELGDIVAITKDGEEIKIIEEGRFVLEGTELLNEAFKEE
ncbi:MAG: aminopeptidase [Eubacterium sp.]|nr:aminopeptidase [Eubacterium sp.]